MQVARQYQVISLMLLVIIALRQKEMLFILLMQKRVRVYGGRVALQVQILRIVI